jgi:NADH:ubiquinone oxidoreductase subunit
MSKWFRNLASTVKTWTNSGKKLVGTDPKGNKYFVAFDRASGRDSRIAQTADGDAVDTTTIPVEWYSWLHHTRDTAPSAELQDKLAKYRETVQKNAKAWEDEQQRQEVQSQVGNQRQASSNAPPSFDYVVKRLRSEDAAPAFTATAREPSNPSDGLSSSQRDQKNPLTPESRLARDTTVRPAQDHTTYVGKDMTGMSTQEVRSEMKKFSQSKTSPFLGVKPQIRTNIAANAEKYRREEEEMKKKGTND